MSDFAIRELWRRVRGPLSAIGRDHLDAFRDVFGPPDRVAVAELDAALRRAGDGPYLPVVTTHGWRYQLGGSRELGMWAWISLRGKDVWISGKPVEIQALQSFSVNLAVPAPDLFIARALDGLLIRGLTD